MGKATQRAGSGPQKAMGLALRLAASRGDLGGVERALAGGADPSDLGGVNGGPTATPWTALMWAARLGGARGLECVRRLASEPGALARDRLGRTALALAAERIDGARVVEALLAAGGERVADEHGQRPLRVASRVGGAEAVALLMGRMDMGDKSDREAAWRAVCDARERSDLEPRGSHGRQWTREMAESIAKWVDAASAASELADEVSEPGASRERRPSP